MSSAPEGAALGLRFVVEGKDGGRARDADRLLAGLASRSPSRAGVARLLLDDSDAAGLDRLVRELNFAAIAAARGNLLFHAGAVSAPDGGTVILCGPSGSGKSTLTVRLVAGGSAYVTDETVCLDPVTLRVAPFCKPVSLKPGSQEALPHLRSLLGTADAPSSGGSWLVPPAALGGAALPSGPLWPQLLVFPTFQRGAACRVERLSAAHAAFLLGQNSSRLREVEPEPLQALARVVRRAPAYRIVHGNVDEAMQVVTDLWAAA